MGAERFVSIEQAAEALNAGEVVAIPTDTVYGLAAALDAPAAIEKLYAIKGRDVTKAIPVLVDSHERLRTFALGVPSAARALAEAFWPGALTIVVPASDLVPVSIHRGAGTVGLRMPDHTAALSIIGSAGGGLAVTSANPSGEPAALTADDVVRVLGDRIHFVVDGGAVTGGKPSTVVDLTRPEMRILRQGAISRQDLERAMSAE